MNALCQGYGLQFSPPQSLNSAGLSQLRALLWPRIQPVTITQLVQRGVVGFCWIPPGDDEMPERAIELFPRSRSGA